MSEEVKVRRGSLDDLTPDDRNMNKHTSYGMSLIEKSIRKHKFGRSILVDKNGRIIGGNGVTETAASIGATKTIVVETTGDELVVVKRTDVDLDSKEGREMALADNATAVADIEWDAEAVKEIEGEFEISPDDWGVIASEEWQDDDEDELERKRREFEERMKAGELSDDDPEYQEFLAKFEAKKTTDDCYTPVLVYDAIADWVAAEYGVSRANFVRPFYPNGDYQREKYNDTDIVVDNPPFSILAEILNFYKEKKVRFFLFAPTLTLFHSSSSCALPLGVAVTYENGANVNTSFLTNLEPATIRLRTAPSLYAAVKEANDKNLKEIRKQLPKYAYDHHIITAPFVAALSRLGIEFAVPVEESQIISQLDSQKDSGKTIYGRGYIVSDRVFAEREKAEREKAEREKAEREKVEREKAEREKAERWELSEREREIVAILNKAAMPN